MVLHVSFNGIASFSRVQTGPHLAFCDRVILCVHERGGRIVWREIGVPAEFIYLQQVLLQERSLKLIGNVSQNILPTVGLSSYISCVQERTEMRRKGLTPPSIKLFVSFIKCMLIWTEGQ